jgi:hypothetical protein
MQLMRLMRKDGLGVETREGQRHEEAHAERQHVVVEIELGVMAIDPALAKQHVGAGATQ